MEECCCNIGCVHDNRIICLTALTGSAATEIKGQTMHKECKLDARSKISYKDILEWLNARLLVVDKMSFVGYNSVLPHLSKSLQALKKCPKFLCGRIHQLEPVNHANFIHKFKDSCYWQLCINLVIELDGRWRFKDCPDLQKAFNASRLQGLIKK